MRLTLPTHPTRGFAHWNGTLHKMLAASGLFDVAYSDDLPRPPRGLVGPRTENMSVVDLDGKLVAIDTWDDAQPTHALYGAGEWSEGGSLEFVDLLLKIQWQAGPFWDTFTAETGVPVSPWTIFPSREWELGGFRYNLHDDHQYVGLISGAMRSGRGEYFDAARAADDFYVPDEQTKERDWERFWAAARSCRWGISLKGKRGTDGKNRREIEYASCGVPLAMNYCPSYPWHMEPGRHFVLLESAADMLALRLIDPAPYAAAADEIYREYWSPPGMARLFAGLVEEYCHG